MSFELFEINDEHIDLLQPLAEDALEDGYQFVKRTIDEWKEDINRFDLPNEVLYGVMVEDEIVAIGGINQDPYKIDTHLGRVRHVYVRRDFRGKGISKSLMDKILTHGKKHFKTIRLSTNNPVAASIYESYGFQREFDTKQTHILYKTSYK